MTLALVGLAVLAVVIFAFVLEPIVRAHGDQAVLDAAAFRSTMSRSKTMRSSSNWTASDVEEQR